MMGMMCCKTGYSAAEIKRGQNNVIKAIQIS